MPEEPAEFTLTINDRDFKLIEAAIVTARQIHEDVIEREGILYCTEVAAQEAKDELFALFNKITGQIRLQVYGEPAPSTEPDPIPLSVELPGG